MRMRINMAKAREKAAITQTALAQTVGVAQSTIARIESGENMPGAELGCKIAAALGISVEELLKNSEYSELAESEVAQ